MALPSPPVPAATAADPFSEQATRRFRLRYNVLGGCFHFTSDSEALLQLVEAAYVGLPSHELPGVAHEFHIEMRLVPSRAACWSEPPPVRQHSGAGLLCGVMDEGNYVVIDPHGRRALVVASQDLLEHPYHLRYELIEFAVFTLATRGIGLVPLHGACVGSDGRGLLLLGASGAGKSTLTLHSLLNGLDFLAEDAVFVRPDSLLATGVSNYLHLRPDALNLIEDTSARHWLGRAPRIRRRSGAEKIEADLRQGPARLAPAPLRLVGAVMVRPEQAAHGEDLLIQVGTDEAPAWLATNQPYAAGQPGWGDFVQALVRQGLHALRRGAHPDASTQALRRLLA